MAPGYGDFSPSTMIGRCFISIGIVGGIVFFSVQTVTDVDGARKGWHRRICEPSTTALRARVRRHWQRPQHLPPRGKHLPTVCYTYPAFRTNLISATYASSGHWVLDILATVELLRLTTKTCLEVWEACSCWACWVDTRYRRSCLPCCLRFLQFFRPFRVAGRSPLRVVILVGQSFDRDTKQWLDEHPYYKDWVTYLRGSVFERRDLQRASAAAATACFVLSRRRAADDSRNVLRVLALRQFVPDLPLHVLVDSVQMRQHILAADVPRHNICCVDMLKMGLIAQNCMTPGTTANTAQICDCNSTSQADGWKATEVPKLCWPRVDDKHDYGILGADCGRGC